MSRNPDVPSDRPTVVAKTTQPGMFPLWPPEAPEDEITAKQTRNIHMWEALQKHGVTEATELRLDFFYELPTRARPSSWPSSFGRNRLRRRLHRRERYRDDAANDRQPFDTRRVGRVDGPRRVTRTAAVSSTAGELKFSRTTRMASARSGVAIAFPGRARAHILGRCSGSEVACKSAALRQL